MHEMGIAEAVLENTRKQLARYPGARVKKVGLRIGELSAINPDALRFSFEILVRGTEFESTTLAIEEIARQFRCRKCGTQFVPQDGAVQCPACGSDKVAIAAGDELDLAFLELETP